MYGETNRRLISTRNIFQYVFYDLKRGSLFQKYFLFTLLLLLPGTSLLAASNNWTTQNGSTIIPLDQSSPRSSELFGQDDQSNLLRLEPIEQENPILSDSTPEETSKIKTTELHLVPEVSTDNPILQIQALTDDPVMTEAEPELSPEELLSREKPFSDPTYGTEVIPTPDTADRTPIKTLQPKPMDSLPGLGQNTNNSTTIPEISSEIPNVQNFDSMMTLPQQSYQSGGMGKSRNEDGSMRGNPYSSEYNQNYSGSFATPKSLRDIPPVAAYGKNMWGEPSIPTCPGANCGWLYWLTKNLEAEIGILGFRNPLDIENNGNFGADAALNWSIPKRICFGLAAQGGARVTQTALNGTNDNGFETNKQRTQLFWTSGIFYRNPCCNWQWGVVYDSLNDSYYRHYTLGQVRGELSCRWTDHCDLGFRGAFGLNTKLVNFWRFDDDVYAKTNATPTSYYTGFIRKYFDFGGEGIFYGGVTEWGEGLIGGQIEAPLSNHCSLKNDFMYVFAKNRGLQKSYEQTWNISASLVIYIDGNSCEQLRNPLKPLFDVANNGTFLQNYKR